MKIARFKRIGSGDYLSILTSLEVEQYPAIYGTTAFVRVSEWVEVDFTPRASDEAVSEQLAALNSVETELRNQFAQRLHEIEKERAKLRAITFQPVAA